MHSQKNNWRLYQISFLPNICEPKNRRLTYLQEKLKEFALEFTRESDATNNNDEEDVEESVSEVKNEKVDSEKKEIELSDKSEISEGNDDDKKESIEASKED